MKKKEQSSRQIVICHLVTILGVDIVQATQLIDEMEQVGLIRFDEFGNVEILVLEGQS
ncbi:hypothetical protein QLT09_08600 [Streptococcus equi subsp. zooepidemicus]|uniref:hypothetical protein n=1 Tax=Streptococcus equi TaxID=1336 RepID=UPI0015519F6E|nr:hypothetical protein [Streptococcus equi]NQO27479.1 hypothetical protein [Streptococcus suis]MDI5918782.1 hypothetical protein [Streptococcus equi subsp. zooepidemicus]MDI5956843.1 hypothetical protein [Streptococcus equi subsp. zooepidemicus]HEM5136823.1 hypothetical protein [Streptococcus suis]HEM5177816.1 hypothetical protein [Streptococcus suis]